jgi:ankyrin repeat protein
LASRLVLALVLLASTLSAQGRPPAESFYQAIRNDDLVALAALARTHGTTVTDAQGQTPLIVTAAFGSLEAVRLLLDAGAGINAASNAGLTALHLAAGDVRKVQLLLDRGAAVDVPSKLGRTPLLVAASSQGATAVVQLLLDRGANINHADQQGLTALIAAASVDDSATVKLLLQRGADPAVRAPAVPQSATALMATAYNGNEEVTRLLLARKPDVHARSSAQGQPVRNGNVQFANVTGSAHGSDRRQSKRREPPAECGRGARRARRARHDAADVGRGDGSSEYEDCPPAARTRRRRIDRIQGG